MKFSFKLFLILLVLHSSGFARAYAGEGSYDTQERSKIAPIVGHSALAHIFTFLEISDMLTIPKVCKLFGLANTKAYSDLSVELANTGACKLFFQLSEQELLDELPLYEEVSKKFGQIYTEVKLLDLIETKFNSSRTNPKIGNITLAINHNGQLLNLDYFHKINWHLDIALNKMRGPVRLLNAALDVLEEDMVETLSDTDVSEETLSNVDDSEEGSLSASALAEQKFLAYAHARYKELYDNYTTKVQWGDVLPDVELVTQIKMAISMDLRKSQAYHNLVEAQSEVYEEEFPTINERIDSLEALASAPLLISEQSSRYKGTVKKMVGRIINTGH